MAQYIPAMLVMVSGKSQIESSVSDRKALIRYSCHYLGASFGLFSQENRTGQQSHYLASDSDISSLALARRCSL